MMDYHTGPWCKMSAAKEELLEQILNLEETIKIINSNGGNTHSLEDQLFQLKEKFQLMNEALKEGKKILKG